MTSGWTLVISWLWTEYAVLDERFDFGAFRPWAVHAVQKNTWQWKARLSYSLWLLWQWKAHLSYSLWLYDWQLSPFSPGGFTACASSAAWVFLALLLKNHSRCVLNSLSPLLHKAELPTYAHIINNEQATLCSIFSKYNSFTILQQSVKDEERVPEVLSLYFQHQRESEDLFPHRLADRFCTLACLIYDKELAASRSRSLFSLTNASAKTSLSV